MTAPASAARRYLTVRDLCERFGVSRNTLWRWQRTGYFPPPVRFAGHTIRWPAAEVESFEARLERDRGGRGVAA